MYNLTDRCAIQPRASCTWQFSLNLSYGISWDGKYHRKSGTGERKIKWSLSPPLTETGLSFVANNAISCFVINYSPEAGFMAASKTLFYRLVEVNTESLAEPMPRVCHKSFADCCAAVS